MIQTKLYMSEHGELKQEELNNHLREMSKSGKEILSIQPNFKPIQDPSAEFVLTSAIITYIDHTVVNIDPINRILEAPKMGRVFIYNKDLDQVVEYTADNIKFVVDKIMELRSKLEEVEDCLNDIENELGIELQLNISVEGE